MARQIDDLVIYNYCEERWAYYKKLDGGYFPSKHDYKVFEDTVRKFDITVNKAEHAFNRIAKIKADKEVKGMTKQEMVKEFERIVTDNKETPWGQESLKSK
jgi:hypothetical protein